MKVTLFDFEHRGEGTYFSCYVPTKLNLNEFGNLASGDLLINDSRMISRKQQKKIYAMIGDISDYTGHHVEFLKSYLKSEYIAMYGGDWFSLSYVDMTTARKFIEFILHICFEWEVPLSQKTVDLAREVNNYLFLCLKHRKYTYLNLTLLLNGKLTNTEKIRWGKFEVVGDYDIAIFKAEQRMKRYEEFLLATGRTDYSKEMLKVLIVALERPDFDWKYFIGRCKGNADKANLNKEFKSISTNARAVALVQYLYNTNSRKNFFY